MKILITGARGTIGGVLLHWLRNAGHEVWSVDLTHWHDIYHVRCDIADFRQLQRIFDAHTFDMVFHLAAEYGRWNGEDYYEQMWRSNVVGTKNILRLQKTKRFKLVFTSTSEVYGDADDVMTETLMDEKEVRQLNDYALSKWVNEQQILNDAAMFGTETVRVRLFNTYGPGEYYTPFRSAICRFAFCALLDRPYTVYLNHHRSAIFISDTVRTLSAILDAFIPGEVYNIGGKERHDMKTISDMILKKLGKDDTLVTYAKTEPFTTRDKRLDNRKAAEVLGHDPVVNLVRGLEQTLGWMQQVYVKGTDVDPNLFMEGVS